MYVCHFERDTIQAARLFLVPDDTYFSRVLVEFFFWVSSRACCPAICIRFPSLVCLASAQSGGINVEQVGVPRKPGKDRSPLGSFIHMVSSTESSG
jgi:hypothetical protein